MLRFSFLLLSVLLLYSCSASKISPLTFFKKGNEAMQAQEYKKAIDAYKMAISLDSKQPVYYYNLAVIYYRLELNQAALANLNKALDLDPNFAEAWYNKALTLHRLKEIDSSLYAYEKYKKLAAKQYAPKSYVKQEQKTVKKIEKKAKQHSLPKNFVPIKPTTAQKP